jgi:hypothetical protein
MNYLDFKDKNTLLSISEYNRKEEIEIIMSNYDTEDEMIVSLDKNSMERLRDWLDNLLDQ